MVILSSQKRACNVPQLSDKVKIWALLKGGMSLPEAGQNYGENGPSIRSLALSSLNAEYHSLTSEGISLASSTRRYRGSTVQIYIKFCKMQINLKW
jgi:hypothetical protein